MRRHSGDPWYNTLVGYGPHLISTICLALDFLHLPQVPASTPTWMGRRTTDSGPRFCRTITFPQCCRANLKKSLRRHATDAYILDVITGMPNTCDDYKFEKARNRWDKREASRVAKETKDNKEVERKERERYQHQAWYHAWCAQSPSRFAVKPALPFPLNPDAFTKKVVGMVGPCHCRCGCTCRCPTTDAQGRPVLTHRDGTSRDRADTNAEDLIQ